MQRLKHFFHTVGVMFTVFFSLSMIFTLAGFAQEAPAAEPVAWWKPLLDMGLNSLLPALWAAVGPVCVAFVTKGVNQLNTRVPRPIQVILSSVIAAVGAGLSGDIAGAGVAAIGGGAAQVYAATKPETLLTTKSE